MDASPQGQWQQIVDLSEEMLSLAKSGEWEQLEQLEQTRRSLLERYFSQSFGDVPTTGIRQGIQHIMQLDKQIYNMSKEAMEQLGKQMDEMTKNKQAVSEYQKNSR